MRRTVRDAVARRFTRTPPDVADAPAPARAPTLLIADDVESIRALLRAALEPAFTVVGEASNGVEAAARAEELQPDLVLLDLNMPRHDGLEAIAPIRRSCPRTRIVVLSGLAPDVIADKAFALGADRFVDKAQPLAELEAALHDALAGSTS